MANRCLPAISKSGRLCMQIYTGNSTCVLTCVQGRDTGSCTVNPSRAPWGVEVGEDGEDGAGAAARWTLAARHGSRRTGRVEERSQTLAGPARTEVEVEVRDGAAGCGRALPNPSRRRGLGNGGGWGGAAVGVRETVEEAVEGSGRGRRRRCRCGGAGGAGGEIGQPNDVHSPISPNT